MKKQLGKILGTLVDGIFYPLNTIQAIAAAITNHNASLTFGQKYKNELERIYKKQGLKEFDAARRKDRKGFFADIALTAAIIGMFSIGGKELPEPVTPSPTGVVSTEPEEHKITIYFHAKEGDWLNKISHATGVYIRDIEEQNPVLKKRGLWAGDILEIEVPSSKLPEIIAGQANDGLNGKFYLTYDAAKHESNILYYTVGKGDFLQDIADAFGVNMDDVMIENNIQNEDYIQAGSVLKITNPMPKYELSTILRKFHLSGTIDFNEKTQISVSTSIETQPIEPVEEESKPSVTLPEGYEKVIDFCSLSGKPNWDELEAAYERGEFTGIILRLAENSKSPETNDYAFTLDKEFETNLQECNKRGIPYGVYIFTRGYTLERIEAQAKDSVNYLESLKSRGITFRPSYPIYGDFEKDANRQYELLTNGKYDTYVKHMKAFGDIIEGAGYFYGAYHNLDVLKQVQYASNYEELLEDQLWLAGGYFYDSKLKVTEIDSKYIFTELDGNKGMLQITKQGIVPGFNGTLIDINIASSGLREMVTNFYKSKYGDDYYEGTTEPSLRGTQIRYAPSRQERRHPGTTIEGVTTALTKATFDLKNKGIVESKSVVSGGQGKGIKHTRGNHGVVRARAKQYPYQRTF